MENLESDSNNISFENSDSVFNMKILLECLIRRRKLVISVASAILFLFFCFAFLSKRVWKGEFQIVLNKKDKNSVTTLSILNNVNNSAVRNLLGSSLNLSSNVNTEVEILKSKSVLMPIFNYVKKTKELNGEKIKYAKWVKQVNVGLKPRTSVLTVSYKDTNKDIVLPVVTRISQAYKEYPGRDKNKGLQTAIRYFDEQISIFSNKSEKSYRDYISFALENNLNILPNESSLRSYTKSPNNGNGQMQNRPTNLNIDPRLVVQNKIKALEMEKKEVESIDISKYDDQALPLPIFSRQIKDSENQLLDAVNLKVLKLSELSNFLTENDRRIVNLKRDIKILNKKMQTNLVEVMGNEIKNLNVRLALISKPKEVVIKSKELQRDLFRLDTILVNLENSKQIISLQLAEKNNPWELISTPFMEDSPVAPKKKQIVLLGLFTSILLGSLCAFYAERFSGIIYSLAEFRSLLNYRFLNQMDLNKTNEWDNVINILGQNIADSKINNLGLALINKQDGKEIKLFTQALEKSIPNINIIRSDNLLDLSSCEDIILLVCKGKVKREELFEFNQKIKLLNKSLLGWIYFSNT